MTPAEHYKETERHLVFVGRMDEKIGEAITEGREDLARELVKIQSDNVRIAQVHATLATISFDTYLETLS